LREALLISGKFIDQDVILTQLGASLSSARLVLRRADYSTCAIEIGSVGRLLFRGRRRGRVMSHDKIRQVIVSKRGRRTHGKKKLVVLGHKDDVGPMKWEVLSTARDVNDSPLNTYQDR
jgi:hypothetical protein